MKRNFLLALLGIVAMLTSCNKEDVGSLATNKTTSFNVSVDGGVQTRAEVTDLTRYVMEVYKGATATGTPEVHKEQANGIFMDVLLNDKQEYTVLFWADYGTPSADGTHNVANEYNAADLKAAKIALQPTNAAYSGVSKFTVGNDEATYTNVKLTHAVAQVNFVQADKLTSAANTLVVTYPESYSLNVGDNVVTKIDGVITHNFTYNNTAAGTLGTSYIIAATGTPKTVLEITATLNSETPKVAPNVPFEHNYRTNISGAYSSKYEASLKVTCDDVWGTPENETVFPKADKLQVGSFYYKDKTFSTTFDNKKTPIGIVFVVNADGKTGKIVGLTEETGKSWSTENIATGATDMDNGALNTDKIFGLSSYIADNTKYPAFALVASQNATAPAGIKWYLPAQNELLNGIYANKTTLNTSLALVSGAAQLSDAYYWSSTDYDGSNAWYVYFGDGSTDGTSKSPNPSSVRVVSAF